MIKSIKQEQRWNWKVKREKKSFLALEDGTIFSGYSFGSPVDRLGEVVFNTGITGYQEIITDPSYCGQLVTLTYPEIGNTGVNSVDRESRNLFLHGLMVHQLNTSKNWRTEESLPSYLKRYGIPALGGIDTRALTVHLRNQGTLKGYLSATGEKTGEEAVQIAREWQGLDGQDYVAQVTSSSSYSWDDDNIASYWGIAEKLPPEDMQVVAYDFGIKWNILRNLRLVGMKVVVVPAHTSAKDVLAMNPDGVFFSNGPADPSAVSYAIENGKQLIGKVPIMGICLGHQILGLACGAKTQRLKFGHHGCNHPVKNLLEERIEITSQNHNFAVNASTLNHSMLDITHISLNDQTVEGIEHKKEPMFAVQYHPEGAPGPHDTQPLFQRFRNLITAA